MENKVKTWKQFLNEKMNCDITHYINDLKNEYLEQYGIDACDINKGECFNFAETLEKKLSKNGYTVEILTTDLFFDTATDYAKEDDDEIFYNPLEYGSIKPNNFKMPKNSYHGWVYVNGKHYDSDTPYGVTNFYHLSIFNDFI